MAAAEGSLCSPLPGADGSSPNPLLCFAEHVRFIDYEYTGYNYQAFDIGNHFNEFAGELAPLRGSEAPPGLGQLPTISPSSRNEGESCIWTQFLE